MSVARIKWLKVFIIVVLGFSLYDVAGQQSGPFKLIRARLVNERTRHPLAYAQVINKNLRSGVFSDSLGVFKMNARIGDTLYIKSISCFTTNLQVDDSLVWQLKIPVIFLKEQVYELGAVDLYGWHTYQEFKYKVLHSPSPDDKLQSLKENLQKTLNTIPSNQLQQQASIPLGSPITALYMMFSKEGKSLRRLEAAKERDRVFLSVFHKFNRDIVGDATGLTGELLDEFMLYCRPTDTFLLVANDYEIHKRIHDDFEQFKLEKESKKNKKEATSKK